MFCDYGNEDYDIDNRARFLCWGSNLSVSTELVPAVVLWLRLKRATVNYLMATITGGPQSVGTVGTVGTVGQKHDLLNLSAGTRRNL